MRLGYYTIIKFVPYPYRDESVNVGVILHSPEDNFLEMRLIQEEAKYKMFRLTPSFNKWGICKDLTEELHEKILSLRNKAIEKKILDKVICSFEKFIVLTDIKKCMLKDPEKEIEKIYRNFVKDDYGNPDYQQTFITELEQRLKDKWLSYVKESDIEHINLNYDICNYYPKEKSDIFTIIYSKVSDQVDSEENEKYDFITRTNKSIRNRIISKMLPPEVTTASNGLFLPIRLDNEDKIEPSEPSIKIKAINFM